MKIQYKDKIMEVDKSTPISEILKDEIKNHEHTVLAAIFNNEYENLNYCVETDGKIELIDTTSNEGMKVYRRTLLYIIGKAFEKIRPDNKMEVNYQLSNAMFCDVIDGEVTDKFIEELTRRSKKNRKRKPSYKTSNYE